MLAKTEKLKVPMTVRMPRQVYDQAKVLVDSRSENIDSLNELVVAAVAEFVHKARRRQIDSAFKGMAGDKNFQQEAQMMAAEFEDSDWESLQTALE